MTTAANPREAVMSGEAWAQFCDHLRRAGEQVLRPEAPGSELDRAEGFRYLTRLLRIGLDMHLEFADADAPGFLLPSHETAKIGADNPDNLYLMSRIDGRQEYLIRGERGSVDYLSFGSQKGGYETDGRMTQTGFLDGVDLQCDAGGRFEIVLSQHPPTVNGLRIEPETNAVIVRQTFRDRAVEQPARMSIRRRDGGTPQPLSAERLATALSRTAHFVEGTARLFADWSQSYLAHPNTLPLADQALCQRVGGDPNIVYYHSYWRLAADEVLVIHLPRIPDCRFWNLQINNWWMESLDYRYHRIHHNAHSAQRSSDGSVTMVLSHEALAHPNRLETTGHDCGTFCLRWVGASEAVQPETRVMRRAAFVAEFST